MKFGGQAGRASSGFWLGPWRVHPDRNRLTGPSGTRTLEPKGMRLLLLLARRAPDTVTREEMIDALWQGRVVTDDAVNKQISKVRAAVTDPSGRPFLETVPKIGVRLTVQPREPEIARSSKSSWITISGALGLVLIGIFLARPQPMQLIEDPITSTPGAELDPALSPDGRMLAYIEKAGPMAHGALLMRLLSSDTSTRISPPDADAAAPSWSGDGKLAFVLRRSGDCTIYVRQPNGRTAPVGECVGAEAGRLAWAGPNRLIVSDRPGLGQSYRLWTIDLLTGRRSQLTAPSSGTVGDIRPLTNRDQSAVYFIRNPTVGNGDLYKVDLSNHRVERVADGITAITGIALGTGDSIILSGQRGSDGPALWRYSPEKGWDRLSPRPAQDISGSADGHTFVFSQVERQTVLWQLPLDGSSEGHSLSPSTRSDWSPVASPDSSRLAFLSNRSGNEEVWVLNLSGGRARRVSQFGGPAIQDLAWSPDGRRLLTSVPTGDQFDIVEIDVTTGAERNVVATPLDERHGTYGDRAQSVDFVRRSNSSFDLVRRDLNTGREAILTPSVMRVVPGTSDSPVFTRPFQSGVWVGSADGQHSRLLASFPDVTRMRDIAVDRGTVYAVQTKGPAAALVAIDLKNDAQRPLRDLPDIARPSGIAVLAGSVIYARVLRSEADLYKLRIQN